MLAAEALAHAVAPYLQLLGADSDRRRLRDEALRALGPALGPIGGVCFWCSLTCRGSVRMPFVEDIAKGTANAELHQRSILQSDKHSGKLDGRVVPEVC